MKLQDYDKLVDEAVEKSYHLDKFINNGSFESYLIQGFRSINLSSGDIEYLFSKLIFYSADYVSFGAILDEVTVYISFKKRDMKHFVSKRYEMVENIDIKFDQFAAKIAYLYYEHKRNERDYYSNYGDEDNEDGYDDDI
ncbi:MAG: hypothetical protein WC155_03600 [Candidatus Cloacimonadales bacterium]